MGKRKVTIYYHSADADGWSSAALLDYFITNNYLDLPFIDEDDIITTKMKFWNYGFQVRENEYIDSDLIFLADVNFPEQDMINMIESRIDKRIIILDHHESSFEMLSKYESNLSPYSIINNDNAACIHTYKFIKKHLRKNVPFKTKQMLDNLFIFYSMINYWDTYTYNNLDGSDGIYPMDIVHLNYYLNSVGAEYNSPSGSVFWNDMFEKAYDEEVFFNEIKEMINIGEIIYRSFQKNNVTMLRAYSFDVNFEGYEMLCINAAPGQGSSYFMEWPSIKKYQLVCNFYYAPKKNEWSFSIYSLDENNEIDLCPVWQKYNHIRSGGHKGSGSIRCKSFEYDAETRSLKMHFS